MAPRPSYLNSRYLRLLCPSKTSSRSYAASTHTPPSSHQPTEFSISEDQIARLSSKPLHSLTLADLVKHGRPPLSANALFSSANFILSLLPARLAHRIQALRNLPFIVVSNPNIARIYNNYLHSLSTLVPYQERQISNLEDEKQFTNVMADLVQTHSNTIPILAQGFLECRKYIDPQDVTKFLDEHLRARIGTRLIAEQHIALHLSSQTHDEDPLQRYQFASPSYIGVIDTALRPSELIQRCESFVSEICELKYGVRPRVSINGQVDTTFAHVPTHLEYILTELLKNAFRATVENGKEREPIEITIAASPHIKLGSNPTLDRTPPNPKNSPSTSGVTIRIRDRGGGISPANLPNIWAYSFTTFSDNEIPVLNNGKIDALNTISGAGGSGGGGGGGISGVAAGGNASSLAGLGYGLPLGRAYAEYFGGGIAVQSLWGWGTDVYLTLKGLDGGI